MKIAISKGIGSGTSAWKYLKYGEWIRSIDPAIEIIELSGYPESKALELLSTASGLLLSGGPDIDPVRYGQEERRAECEMDQPRDVREWKYVDLAIASNIPILGICRGMQLLNVYFGGTLVVDIPSDINSPTEHRKEGGDDAQHEIRFTTNSLLGSVNESATVNSAHHQCLAKVANGFEIIAKSTDGVIEAISSKDGSKLPKIFGVQWHPERMDLDQSMSSEIAKIFISLIYGKN